MHGAKVKIYIYIYIYIYIFIYLFIYLNIQFVPRSKHTLSLGYTNQSVNVV